MKRGKIWLRWTAFFLVFIGFNCAHRRDALSLENISLFQNRVDIIKIDLMPFFGNLEKPPVLFLHDMHTNALSKKEMDCTTCHFEDNGLISQKFKRIKDTDRVSTMNIYHEGCISCHGKLRLAQEETGPVECVGCHNPERKAIRSLWRPIRLDKHLHYTHVKSNEEKCELCHHEYDKKTEKLVYKKGKENACSYCHGEVTIDKALPYREVAHASCIGCHRNRKANNKEFGPLDCNGCHDVEMQLLIKKPQNIPRLDRGQPDGIFVKNGTKKRENNDSSICMPFVPFDHEAHEEYNDTCIVCHHASLESCSECHMNGENDEGKNIRLADAMHGGTSESSCVGCHRSKQKEKKCAGCHVGGRVRSTASESSCNICHLGSGLEEPTTLEGWNQSSNIAANLLKDRVLEAKIYTEEDIPETIIISALENQYKSVSFPHRKIVLSLLDGTKSSKLAVYFHSDKGTICLGCHHNSPLSRKPPACGNCHGDGKNISMPFRPGLVGAYHQQCIGCHNAMGLEKPDSRGCDSCHSEKNVSTK